MPWAERYSRFTALLERWAIDLLRACSITAAETLLRLTWGQVWGIKARAVRRGLKRRAAEPVPHLAEAEIVFDKFYIAQHLHTAVDQVRRAEQRGLCETEDTWLIGTKYLWLRRPKDLPAAQRTQLRTLLQSDLKVARAWMLKEQFQRFQTCIYPGVAKTFFARWFWRATHSRLRPMAQVAKMIQRHLPNVLT